MVPYDQRNDAAIHVMGRLLIVRPMFLECVSSYVNLDLFDRLWGHFLREG